eukprot:scaffold16286_cov80-Skeletonema_menzelii.AAC.1
MSGNLPDHLRDTVRGITNVSDLPARYRKLIGLVDDPNYIWTLDEVRVLNATIKVSLRRNEAVHTEVDDLNTPLCTTVAYRFTVLAIFQERAYQAALERVNARQAAGEDVATPTRKIVRLPNDDLNRGRFAIVNASYIETVADFLHIAEPSPAEIRARQTHKTKFKRIMREHYNSDTKERLELTSSDEYAVILSHSDFAVGRDPKMLSRGSGFAHKFCKLKSEMSRREINKVDVFYENHEN